MFYVKCSIKYVYSVNISFFPGFPGPPFLGRYYLFADKGIVSGPQPRLIVARIQSLDHLLALSHLLGCYRIWLDRTVIQPSHTLWHPHISSCWVIFPSILFFLYFLFFFFLYFVCTFITLLTLVKQH